MGEVRVPASARWAAQTQRAVENFPISGRSLPSPMIAALGHVKAAAAEANGELEVLEVEMASAIAAAADEVASGRWDDHFPVDVFQTGSGTSSNMNANEVIASLATERLGRPVHPNDEVNASQSSNDVFPSAMHIAAASQVTNALLPAVADLAEVLGRKAEDFANVVKSGRTHLMDATPVTLGQELSGYRAQVLGARDDIEGTLARVCALPLGGTAVGTGLNCPPDFATLAIGKLAARTGLPLTEISDHMAGNSSRDGLVALSGQVRVLATALMKIANDLRWMGSGPRTGLAEVRLPDLQPGSSIMPGKVNPVVPEAVTQVCVHVFGNDTAVAFAGSQGNFELNVYLPMMAHNLLESIALLGGAARLLADRCLSGIEANVEQCKSYAESSPALGTSLNTYIGYEAAAEIVKESTKTGRSVREIVTERGLMTDDQVDAALDVLGMTRGGHR